MIESAERAKDGDPEPFGYCLNTSTLKGFDLGILEQIDIAAAAGYGGVEPWVRDVVAYRDGGGHLATVGRRCADAGLKVAGAIAFFKWADADASVRAEALEDARRQMEVVAAIGGRAIAAPPFGDVAGVSLDQMAECFHALCEVGRQTGVKPILEFWGPAKRLSRLCEAAYVAVASGVGDAQILVDVYHLYKGGGAHASVGLLNGSAIGIVHINDYPADPPRETISDPDRVFPGDGVAPMDAFLQALHAIGYRGMLSLELFNADYQGRSAPQVAAEGLAKTRAAVQRALAGATA